MSWMYRRNPGIKRFAFNQNLKYISTYLFKILTQGILILINSLHLFRMGDQSKKKMAT